MKKFGHQQAIVCVCNISYWDSTDVPNSTKFGKIVTSSKFGQRFFNATNGIFVPHKTPIKVLRVKRSIENDTEWNDSDQYEIHIPYDNMSLSKTLQTRNNSIVQCIGEFYRTKEQGINFIGAGGFFLNSLLTIEILDKYLETGIVKLFCARQRNGQSGSCGCGWTLHMIA